MISSAALVAALKNNDVSHVVGVPDNGTRALFEALWTDVGVDVVLVSREGEAFGLASGLYLGGSTPIVLIQNTGFFEAGDAFRGTAYNMGIPLVMLLGYRGYRTMEPGAPRVDTAATFFEPTLKAWDIPYTQMFGNEDIGQIDNAFRQARARSLPAAVLLVEETD